MVENICKCPDGYGFRCPVTGVGLVSRGVVSAFATLLYSSDFQISALNFTEAVFAMYCQKKKFNRGAFSVKVY